MRHPNDKQDRDFKRIQSKLDTIYTKIGALIDKEWECLTSTERTVLFDIQTLIQRLRS